MGNPLSRRTLIKAGIGAATLGGLAWLRPGDMGAPHNAYFTQLSAALNQHPLTRPTLVIDKNRLLQNIETLTGHIYPDFHYRIVAKSLPSIPLLKMISSQSKSNRFMLFNERFLIQVARDIPSADILMGKPMPVAAAEYFYQRVNTSRFMPDKQLQWLIDTPARLNQYRTLANQREQAMNINIELDVGLHRGGVKSDSELTQILTMIRDEPLLHFSGLMGYEPHVVKIPGDSLGHLDTAMDTYRQRIKTIESFFGEPISQTSTLNTGGSPSYQLHTPNTSIGTELAAGSCLVKPQDFDLPTLADHHAASFIATPVLKQLDQTEIPGVSGLGDLMSAWDPNRQQSFFTYGGYWKAKPVSPPGLDINPIYGRSTNQEMLNGSSSIPLKPDDWIFLRPTQSEFVFLQFGDIAVYQNGQIIDLWPILS